MLKLRCFASAAFLLITSASTTATDLGYRTEGYTAMNHGSNQYSNGGHRHFTKPAYSNSSNGSYYRSYHAHKDAVHSGAYVYGAPWAWAYHGNGYPNFYHSYPVRHLDTGPAPAPTRRLLKTQDGQCYEVKRNGKGEELRTELSAESCNW